MKSLIRVLLILWLVIWFWSNNNPAYADVCQEDNGKVIINGTPQPSLINCPPMSGEIHSSTVTVHSSSQPAPTQPPKVVTVIVTATPTSTVEVFHAYKAVYAARFTPTLTAFPTATPSATPTKTPTIIQKPKTIQQQSNIFQNIAHFFQNIFHSIFRN
ncbi:MAG TPA: hypothetical protein VEP90_17070 [Methylomirabilota bacterium]|nr:hypothetical protein [Methylomirabilota bacterium]